MMPAVSWPPVRFARISAKLKTSPRLPSSTVSMYGIPPIEHCWKSIWLHVSVPVLSLKMYSICPSSSTSDEVRQSAGVSVGA